jgi:DNA-binding FadR family transcriptional regulator
MIVRGELAAGDWLPTEAELMARFYVSRPTLREAFRLLEADSLIQIRQGPPGGARVRTPGPAAAAPIVGLLLALNRTTVADVYDARLLVEPNAARRLAENGSPADHTCLRGEVSRVLAVTGDPLRFLAAGTHLAQRLVELAGNRSLALISGVLAEVIRRHVELTVVAHPEMPQGLEKRLLLAADSYRQLSDYVDARDGSGAERCWRAHLRASAAQIVRVGDQVVDLIG